MMTLEVYPSIPGCPDKVVSSQANILLSSLFL